MKTHIVVVGTLESEGLGPTGMVWLGGNSGNHSGKSGNSRSCGGNFGIRAAGAHGNGVASGNHSGNIGNTVEIVETTLENVETHVVVVGTLESEGWGPREWCG